MDNERGCGFGLWGDRGEPDGNLSQRRREHARSGHVLTPTSGPEPGAGADRKQRPLISPSPRVCLPVSGSNVSFFLTRDKVQDFRF